VTLWVAFVRPSLASGGAERVTLTSAGGIDRGVAPQLIVFDSMMSS